MPDAVDPWDTQYIIFTSGTTGPSKAVLSSYLQGYSMGTEAHPRFDGDDRTLVNLPLFHVGGTVFINIALATGGSCVVDTHFRTDEFWSTVNEHNVTAVCLLAAMVPFLLNLPEFEGEQDHSLRTTVIVPWTEEAMRVTKRYNLDALTTFNMTEVPPRSCQTSTRIFLGCAAKCDQASRPGWSTTMTAKLRLAKPAS